MEICKFSRVVNNGRNTDHHSVVKNNIITPDDEDDKAINNGAGDDDAAARLRVWHPSSRIIRVSRASGGKDRHSKVWTSKGLRDRRVRLSVTTAIQFYDLQDRLGYDQPSKAVEWLIKAASESIAELPSLSGAFSETPKQLSDENRAGSDHEHEHEPLGLIDSADLDENEFGGNRNRNQNHLSLSKSACSSTSDTSKGSGLSLSRPDVKVNRVKARERARERAAKEKDNDCSHNPISSSSFTELLTNGGSSANPRQWSPAAMDYFSSGSLLSRSPAAAFQLGINSMSMSPFNENHQEVQLQPPPHPPPPHQHFSFDHSTTGADYNLNFNLAGNFMNRGTLQSNSSPLSTPSVLVQHPFQRYATNNPNVESNLPFFIGTPSSDNHQFPGLDGSRLQLYYGDGTNPGRHSDQKGKGKH